MYDGKQINEKNQPLDGIIGRKQWWRSRKDEIDFEWSQTRNLR